MLYYRPHNLINVFRDHKKFRDLSVPGPTVCPNREKSISVCTTCMNRLDDLKRTLPKNIEDNKNYDNAEFILLDYGSSEDIEGWVKKRLMHHIESGRLKFYRTKNKFKYFRPSHARNLSFRLAQNELVTNVDSDNMMNKGFLRRLNECAGVGDERILICADNFLEYGSNRLRMKGRFCVYKKDIEMLRGFDEDLDEGFSHDDVNFVFRAMLARFKIVRYEKRFNDGRIETSDKKKLTHIANHNWDETRKMNQDLTLYKLTRGRITVNRDREWGQCELATT